MVARSSIKAQELQHITEEVYKRNAELAVKNKTLSLLHELYKITAATLEVEPLTEQLTRSIAKILHLPFVAILTKGEDARRLYPRSAISAIDVKKQLSDTRDAVVLFPTDHPCVTVLKEKKKKRERSFVSVVLPFINELAIEQISSELPVRTTLLMPLQAGGKASGVLVLGLDRLYRDLSKFERESIESLVDVVSVALDRSSVYGDLKAANIKLKELDGLKTEFLSIASHQLRTPLSIIKGYTSLLEEGAYGAVTNEQKEIFTNIDVSNERLIKLVDEFLNISRIEQGRTKYAFGETDVVAMGTGVVEELRRKAGPRKITVEYHPTEGLPTIIADEERLRHCLYNYVDNAIKYSKEGAVIDVYLEKKDKGIQARVVDKGAGLDEKDLNNLFQKFYRSPHVMRDVQGTGLGLYVVRQFAEAHGGKTWAASDGVGKGSEFGFWVPATPTGKIYQAWKRDKKKGEKKA